MLSTAEIQAITANLHRSVEIIGSGRYEPRANWTAELAEILSAETDEEQQDALAYATARAQELAIRVASRVAQDAERLENECTMRGVVVDADATIPEMVAAARAAEIDVVTEDGMSGYTITESDAVAWATEWDPTAEMLADGPNFAEVSLLA